MYIALFVSISFIVLRQATTKIEFVLKFFNIRHIIVIHSSYIMWIRYYTIAVQTAVKCPFGIIQHVEYYLPRVSLNFTS
jgi:uncharacterized membrane protein